MTIVAWGGAGKTSLVARWRGELMRREFDGASYFDWYFSNQEATEQASASSDWSCPVSVDG